MILKDQYRRSPKEILCLVAIMEVNLRIHTPNLPGSAVVKLRLER